MSLLAKMSLVVRKPVFGGPDQVPHKPQSHKMARGLKFRIYEVEGLYYLCSENKGADQLRGCCEADLRLCFRICKKLVFSQRGSNNYCHVKNIPISSYKKNLTKV